MTETVKVTSEKIRKLEVQGARNVAIAAIKALQALTKETKAKTKQEFLKELSKAQELLFASRETEPLMRNAVRWVISQAENTNKESVKELGEIVSLAATRFLESLDESREQIAKIGAKRIHDGTVVFTHCHSSTITRLLSQAKADGKAFKVICTETRPTFQGRITAKEMVELGVETTFIVDSAARSFISKADLVIVGADAITSEGNVVNKIGTGTLALLAYEDRKPFYVVSELLKFDPETLHGSYESIEQRSPSEVWKDAPEGLRVRNPAFDVTPSRYIHGLICEEGVIAPQAVVEATRRRYPWIF